MNIFKEDSMKVIKLIISLSYIALFLLNSLFAQSYAGSEANVELMMLVDKPTAGLLKYGTYSVSGGFFQRGGILLGIYVGVFQPFTFGVSYGGTDIIGQDAVHMNPLPGVFAKLRIINEGYVNPALVIGFDSQGKDPYLDADSLERYTIKSPGLYLVASKNYDFLGYLSLHCGVNKTLETKDGDKDLNVFVGLEKSLSSDISVIFEYDFAFNDDNNAVGKGNGYLNFGFRWFWGKGLVMGFNLKNITRNQNNIHFGNRTLQIDYTGSF